MKTIKFTAIAFAAILFAACGSKKESSSSDDIDTSFATETTDDCDSTTSGNDESSYEASDYSSDESDASSSDASEESSSTSSSSEDWDSLLDSYSEYVDQYVALAKKAKNGDETTMSEAAELVVKANEMNSKLVGAKGDMSASQWTRYMKITAKMTKIAL